MAASLFSPKYKVDAKGFKNLKKYYHEGDQVEIWYSFIRTDTDYSFSVTVEKYDQGFENDKGYVIRLIMPPHDVKVEVKSRNTMTALPYPIRVIYEKVGENGFRCETDDVMLMAEITDALMGIDPDKKTTVTDMITVVYVNREYKRYEFSNENFDNPYRLEQLRSAIDKLYTDKKDD